MAAVLILLFALSFSVLATRVGGIALMHTGLSGEAARFQARSAFNGVGFTTAEAEAVVNHPVRRQITMLLMLLGNAGHVTAVSTLILTVLSFEQGGSGATIYKVFLLTGGLVTLWLVTTSRWIDRRLQRIVAIALERFTHLDTRDYASLLQLTGDYRVSELLIQPGDWIANKTLAEARLRSEGITVLGIHRANGHYLGSPSGDTAIHAHDRVLVYGRVQSVEKLDTRGKGWRGDVEHHGAIVEATQVRTLERIEEDEPQPAR